MFIDRVAKFWWKERRRQVLVPKDGTVCGPLNESAVVSMSLSGNAEDCQDYGTVRLCYQICVTKHKMLSIAVAVHVGKRNFISYNPKRLWPKQLPEFQDMASL